MAKRNKSRGMRKIAPAITDLSFQIPAGGGASIDARNYIDTARELSRINRRLYDQGRMYAYQGLTFIWKAQAAVGAQTLTTIELNVRTAGNTWVVQNAFVKGKALWDEMQDLVLDDNPSIAGKWHDFKVKLAKTAATNRTLAVLDGQGVEVAAGKWNYSTYVIPQHDVNPADGLPLAPIEVTAHLIGDDGTAAGVLDKVSLVKAYQESRATVQPIDPNVPANMSTSFFNVLTDSGSQEPELADVIEDENDEPPYDADNYPGGDTNANVPMTVAYSAISQSEVDGRTMGFIAPCGLLEIEVKGYDQDGVQFPVASMPAIDLLLHVAPGTYKGIAAIPMGQ